jgi:hypothetical protein
VLAAFALGAGAQAQASELKIAGQTQAPDVLYAFTTTLVPGGACDLAVLDGSWEFPTPLTLAPGAHRARILYGRRDRPTQVKVMAARSVDERSKPAGRREILDATLSRAHGTRGQRTGWRATFNLRPPYFLTVATRWAGDPGCGLEDESLLAYSVALKGGGERAGAPAGS